MRCTSRTLPAGNTWTYVYYTDSAGTDPTADNPCTTGTVETTQQGASLKTRTAPTPDVGSAIVESFVYDKAGRLVATWIGSESPTCVTYDGGGRLLTRDVPAFGGEAARDIDYNYDVANNPLVMSVTDAAGIVTTEIDLLGRPVKVTGVWGVTATTTYDQAGRVTSAVNAAGDATFTYDAAGRVLTQSLDTAKLADVTYDTYGRLESVDYPDGVGAAGNGTSLDVVGYDDLGRLNLLTWKDTASALLTSDAVTRTLAGRIVDQSIDGTDNYPTGDNYTYDATGRLLDARVDGTQLVYEFDDAQTECTSTATSAGKNTNRTTYQIVGTGTYDNCYDDADRLTWTGLWNINGDIGYDAHGNMTNLGSQDMTYDGDNRHLTTTDGTTTIAYVRDATNAIVQRSENSVVTSRSTLGASIDTNDVILETYVTLPGGVQVTIAATGGAETWSYPNIHGDVAAVANTTGTKVGTTATYGPYGGSSTSFDNRVGDFDFGWIGVNPTENAGGLLPIIEMGARPYYSALGRFLAVDPVEGGSANDFDYCLADGVNCSDNSGLVAVQLVRYPGFRRGPPIIACNISLPRPFSVKGVGPFERWPFVGTSLFIECTDRVIVTVSISIADISSRVSHTWLWFARGTWFNRWVANPVLVCRGGRTSEWNVSGIVLLSRPGYSSVFRIYSVSDRWHSSSLPCSGIFGSFAGGSPDYEFEFNF